MSSVEQDWTPLVLRKDDPSKASGPQRAFGAKKLDKLMSENPDPPKKPDLEFRIKLAQARQAAGYSQKDLASKISEQASVIQKLENGTELPSSAVLQKIRRVLKNLL